MVSVNYIDVLSACFIKGVCCKLTYLAAILDAMMDFRISDYQRPLYRLVMDYWSPKLWCRHQIITLTIMKHTDLCNSKGIFAILDSVLKMNLLQITDILRYSVPYSCCHILPITVVTYYVSILLETGMHFSVRLPVWRSFWTPLWILGYMITKWQFTWS